MSTGIEVTYQGKPAYEVIKDLKVQVEKRNEMIETLRRDSNGVSTIRANINNTKLTDTEFRLFVNNTL